MRQSGRFGPVMVLNVILSMPAAFKVSAIIIQLNCITVLSGYLKAHTPKQRSHNNHEF